MTASDPEPPAGPDAVVAPAANADGAWAAVGGIELDSISMSFGANQVLRGVSLDLAPAAVTALIGANGAGKSTLIKILSGVHTSYQGTIRVDGVEQQIDSTVAAHRLGIQTVHQRIDEGIVPGLSVAENLLFDGIASGRVRRFASLRSLLPEARRVSETLQLDWSNAFLRTDVFEIGIADQQLVLLARALSRQPRLLILDEPTSALSTAESERLFDVVRRMRADGVGVLYVSHHLSEIDTLADRMYVLRDGVTRDEQVPPFDWERAVRAMLGEQVAFEAQQIDERRGTEVVVRLDGVQLFATSSPLPPVEIRAGEVTGIVGLLGAGKTELAAGVAGVTRFAGGSMTLDGKPYAPGHPAAAIARGVCLVPEDRAAQSMLPGWSITRTSTLPFLASFSTAAAFLRQGSEARHARSIIDDFGVVADSERQPVDALSGGNQQKVVVGRWMTSQPRVLLLDEPFRGVDIGARRDLSHRIRDLSVAGAAVVVLASDIDEILEVADRIVVLTDGEIRADTYTSETDRDAILTAMSQIGQRHDHEEIPA